MFSQYFDIILITIDSISIAALILMLLSTKRLVAQNLNWRFVYNILLFDLVWCLTVIIENIIILKYVLHYILLSKGTSKSISKSVSIILDIIGFPYSFALFFSLSQAVCISYIFYQESSSASFLLENSYNGLINKCIIIAYIQTLVTFLNLMISLYPYFMHI